MVQDEWVVCRVFQKSTAVKKYPSNQLRGILPYNLETGSSTAPSTMMQPETVLGPDQLAEFNRLLRSGSININPQMQSQMNLGTDGCFTISGLNLNLAGAVTSQATVLRPTLNHHDLNSYGLVPVEPGFEGGTSDANMGMDQCMELDGYWPSY